MMATGRNVLACCEQRYFLIGPLIIILQGWHIGFLHCSYINLGRSMVTCMHVLGVGFVLHSLHICCTITFCGRVFDIFEGLVVPPSSSTDGLFRGDVRRLAVKGAPASEGSCELATGGGSVSEGQL